MPGDSTNKMQYFCLLVSLLLLLVENCRCLEVSLTLEVNPGGRECFHQEMEVGSYFEVEYQVLKGGELDINFEGQNPGADSLVVDSGTSHNIHKGQAPMAGEYIMCFDNSFSHISTKTVFFRVLVSDGTTEPGSLSGVTGSSELIQYEITIESFKNVTDGIGENLSKSGQLQKMFSTIELRDRSIQEYNFERVNFWSGLQLFVMVTVPMVNVLMIRGMFEDPRHKVKSGSGTSKMRT